MAEVTRVLGRMQLDTEGGLVPAGAEGSVPVILSRHRSKLVKGGAKLVKDESEAVSATKAGREMAVARNKAVGCFTVEIGVTKADAGNKEAAGSFTGEIGVTKADAGNKEAAGSFTGEIDGTKAELGNKEAAGKGVVTEAAWIEFVFPVKPPVGSDLNKAEPTGATITKEMVPDSFIDRLKERRVMSPIRNTSGVFSKFPKARDFIQANISRWNYLVDLHEDVLKQHANKGFAEVGIDFTDGVKKIFILPQNQGCTP